MIKIETFDNTFHLSNDWISYVIEIRNGYLIHQYFGEKIERWSKTVNYPTYKRSYATEHEGFQQSFDEISFEFPQPGFGDYRSSALIVQNLHTYLEDFEFKYEGYEILDCLVKPEGMPQLKGEGKTLVLRLKDDLRKIQMELFYGITDDFAGIARFNTLSNLSDTKYMIKKFSSLSLDLENGEDYSLLSICGTHLKEGEVQIEDIKRGKIVLESKRGSSSSQHSPYFALIQKQIGWDHGKAYGFNLLYSGSHMEEIEMDYYRQIRIEAGIHPELFNWVLNPDESFSTPVCLMSCTDSGLNGMAQNFHRVIENRILNKKDHPILANSWEGAYYDIHEDNITSMIKDAASLGMELFVIDDGWFRKENNSRSPIGDWKIVENKFKNGFDFLEKLEKEEQIRIGLWFEPEAVSKNSELYQKHPDWVLGHESRYLVEGRHELLLDLSKKEVQDYIIDVLSYYLKKYPISYIKWDMNRPLSNVVTSMKSHQYVLGLYRILETIAGKFKNVLIEGCSSGGNRLDLGILSYVSQNWASDNTDPFDRIKIQSGLALFFPPRALTAHVSAGINHQTGRKSDIQDRFEITRFFNPGYELDFKQLNPKEMEEIITQVKILKNEREWMDQAAFYQMDHLWAKADSKKEKAEVLIFQEHFQPADALKFYKIPWLDPYKMYEIQPLNLVMSGQQLKNKGIKIPLSQKDFAVRSLQIKEIKN